MLSCALVLPIWTADVDPRVLRVRAYPSRDVEAFRQTGHRIRILRDAGCERVQMDHGDGVLRLDVIAGTLADGPVRLNFEIDDGPKLPAQIAALEAFRGLVRARPIVAGRHDALAARVIALHAFDLRQAGASLRDTADALLGVGDWPGDGDCRKSRLRRLIAVGEAMVRAGPRPILTAQ